MRIDVTNPAELISVLPVAVLIPDVGVWNIRSGFVGYPLPLDAILTFPIPVEFVIKYAVAAAPTP